MKNLIFFVLISSLAIVTQAQNCTYFPLKKGVMLRYESYSAKDKLESSSKTEILEVTNSGNTTTANAKMTSYDKKGKEVYATELPIVCENGDLVIDMRSLIPEKTLEGFKNMEVDIKTDNLSVPSKASPGQKLKDGHMSVSVSTSGMSLGTFKFDITERIVEGREKITVAGKEYEALKITYVFDTKAMMINQKFKIAEWYVQGLGAVKSVTYESDGKSMVSYTLLAEHSF